MAAFIIGRVERQFRLGHPEAAGDHGDLPGDAFAGGKTVVRIRRDHIFDQAREGRGLIREEIRGSPLTDPLIRLAGEHLEQDEAEAVLIGRGPHVARRLRLLRAHIEGSAGVLDDGVRATRDIINLRDAEVSELGTPVRAEEDIGWLDIAMHDADIVGGLQTARHVGGDPQCVTAWQRPMCQPFGEGAATDVFEDEVLRAIRLDDEVMHGDEIRVDAHARSRFGLAREPLLDCPELLDIGRRSRALQRLDRHRPLQTGIEGQHDRAETALPERRVHAVTTEQHAIRLGAGNACHRETSAVIIRKLRADGTIASEATDNKHPLPALPARYDDDVRERRMVPVQSGGEPHPQPPRPSLERGASFERPEYPGNVTAFPHESPSPRDGSVRRGAGGEVRSP